MDTGLVLVKREPGLKRLARYIHTPEGEDAAVKEEGEAQGGRERDGTPSPSDVSSGHCTVVPVESESSALDTYIRSLQREVHALRERDREREGEA
ncbi:hypothetical protein KIPB_016201, partial [Kipferlia bialata]|eukprot:g16201.t1